ncbi:MAG: 4-hydroxythreonine-4-phosphate dehydrogenase PdxA [Gammaproteobacteria bacterium]|nr:4-hydroxythreonine-4-phosphate dehydrogenase PdxA [Gammaproteobacteria bacterium]
MPRLAVTTGEPAGIGPDLCLQLAARASYPAELVFLGDPDLLSQRAKQLGLSLNFQGFDPQATPVAQVPGCFNLLSVAVDQPVCCGQLNPANAGYVLQLLDLAIDGCLSGAYAGMVTAPVQKSVINGAGIPFSGHTEYLAARSATEQVVMMLVAGALRVALVTTHLPLRQVADAITPELLERVIRVLDASLTAGLGRAPAILVCGLNPHAGESGYLGREEIKVIEPVIRTLAASGFDLTGPLPADTAFTPAQLEGTDVVLAMYHDQGLPVLKAQGFGGAVNVTLGLPFVRTSVDHGTALDLAGSGRADPGSLVAAVETALEFIT